MLELPPGVLQPVVRHLLHLEVPPPARRQVHRRHPLRRELAILLRHKVGVHVAVVTEWLDLPLPVPEHHVQSLSHREQPANGLERGPALLLAARQPADEDVLQQRLAGLLVALGLVPLLELEAAKPRAPPEAFGGALRGNVEDDGLVAHGQRVHSQPVPDERELLLRVVRDAHPPSDGGVLAFLVAHRRAKPHPCAGPPKSAQIGPMGRVGGCTNADYFDVTSCKIGARIFFSGY